VSLTVRADATIFTDEIVLVLINTKNNADNGVAVFVATSHLRCSVNEQKPLAKPFLQHQLGNSNCRASLQVPLAYLGLTPSNLLQYSCVQYIPMVSFELPYLMPCCHYDHEYTSISQVYYN